MYLKIYYNKKLGSTFLGVLGFNFLITRASYNFFVLTLFKYHIK